MLNMLESSPFFEKVHSREGMLRRDQDFSRMGNIDRVFWTTAVPTSAIQFSGGANFKLISSPGALLGQAQPLDEPVMLPDRSYTTMGQLKLGDKIASPSEGETEVVGVFPQGKIACYEIELVDGRTVRCSLQHRWRVAYRETEDQELAYMDTTLEFILDHPTWEFYILDEADCYENAHPDLDAKMAQLLSSLSSTNYIVEDGT